MKYLVTMKNFCRTLALLALIAPSSAAMAQGWPAQYGGVMLQGFYWNSYGDSQWSFLEQQSDELAQYFNLIWVPQSGNCNTSHNVMGYMPVYYYDHNSSFGSEAQLRSMISTFRQKGTGILADVVINHRNNLGVDGAWTDFPEETYKGEAFQMLPSDICGNDDGGKTAEWAKSHGISLSPNSDTGEGWDGCRDLDHKSSNVNRCVKSYLDFLLADLGYEGFRYDMVKGYSAAFTADYNVMAKPRFSVGEYWDGTGAIQQWIKGTSVDGVPTSAAFDFQFRYRVRDAINKNDWSQLSSADMVISNPEYRRYAVTFVENHDTEKRSATEVQDPILRDTLAANAYLLMMPGTPCVFYKHWQAYKPEIKAMVEARRLAGIHNESEYLTLASNARYYARYAQGTRCRLLCELGATAEIKLAGANATNFVEVLSGHHYKYLLSRDAECAWISAGEGEYYGSLQTRLVAVSKNDGAEIVYTVDGSEPTAANGTRVASGTVLDIHETATLKAGLLVDGKVTDVCTRHYAVRSFEPYDVTVHVKADWTPVYFYVWDCNNKELNGSWPGKLLTQGNTQTIAGEEWYCQTFSIAEPGYFFNIIFNAGNGKPQTADITRIDSDKYYVAHHNGTAITYEDVTDSYTSGIGAVEIPKTAPQGIYDLQGRRLQSLPPYGYYIRDGRKYYNRK